MCTGSKPPKFEGGERNFFQTDKPVDKPRPPFFSRSAKVVILFFVLGTASSFFTAYSIETSDPDLFLPNLESTNKSRDSSKLPRLTAEEFEIRKKQFLELYRPYISVLRFFGITHKKVAVTSSVWDTSDGNVSGFEEVGFASYGNEGGNAYSYGNSDDFQSDSNDFETFQDDAAFPKNTGTR